MYCIDVRYVRYANAGADDDYFFYPHLFLVYACVILQLASKHAIPFFKMALLFVFDTLIGGVQTTLRADLKAKSTLQRVDSTLIMAGERGS